MEDVCTVCAEPLKWTAAGPCGHHDACSSCIIRLRFVLKDNRCPFCKQESDTVFVTHAAGEFTTRADHSELLSRAQRKDVWHLRDLNMFFDDEIPFNQARALTQLGCQICTAEGQPSGGRGPNGAFANLGQLREHLKTAHKKHMCSVCLEGRKAFVSQQFLYSQADLEKHLSSGAADVDNELGAAGFKGHPQCKFCRVRFYGDGEIFQHMQREHFECHLCKRARPDVYTYYNDYTELHKHFRADHCPCEHPACLEKKFIVFPSPMELKRHMALEHGGDLTKEQKKDALRIEVNFQVRRDQEETWRTAGGRGGRGGRGGGGGGASERGEGSGAGAGGRGGAVRHAASVPSGLGEAQAQAQAAAAAALLSRSAADLAPAAAAAAAAAAAGGGAGMPSVRSVPDMGAAEQQQEAFPPLEGSSRGPTVFAGAAPRWLLAAAAPGTVLQDAQWAAQGGLTADGAGPSGRPPPVTSEELFPALPSMSKSAAKKQKQKDKAAQDAAAAIRASLIAAPQRRGEDGTEDGGVAASRPQSAAAPARAPSGPPPGFPQRPSAASLLAASAPAPVPVPAPAPPAPAPARPSAASLQEAFPPLGGGSGGGRKGSSGSLAASSGRNLSVGSFAAAAAPPPGMRRPGSGAALSAGMPRSGSSASIGGGGAGDPSANRGPAASAAGAGGEDPRAAANRALIAKIRGLLPLVTQDEDFARFRDTSARFRDGSVSADDYLRVVYALGLAPAIPDLCLLLPDPRKQEELSEAAARAIAREEQQRAQQQQGARRSAAAVAAARVEDYTEEDNVLAAALNKALGGGGGKAKKKGPAAAGRIGVVNAAPQPPRRPAGGDAEWSSTAALPRSGLLP